MRPADESILERFQIPMGSLAAGAGTKIWIVHTLLSPDFIKSFRNISVLK
jgi:hypothetical protein